MNEQNKKQRMEFVKFWANYVKTHDDKDWSRQQNIIIDSCIKSSNMTAEQFLKMKGEPNVKKFRENLRR